MKKKLRLYSILYNKCPRCHEGDLFVSHNPYDLVGLRFSQIHEHCPHCGLHYAPKPGFFYGAMYVSYAFNVAFLVAFSILFIWLLRLDYYLAVMSIIASTVVLSPIVHRLSRLIWINIFFGYRVENNSNSAPLT